MADEQLILNIMQAAYEAPKTALGPLGWRPDRQKARYLRMPIACDCGFDITGVSITVTAWADEPDERIAFQLHIDIDGNDYRIARVDWRPRQPHTNKLGPPDLRGTSPYTSIHDFPENASLGLDVMQSKNLPVAKPIDPEPPDFYKLMLYIGDTLKIQNTGEIPEPPWAPVLQI